MNDIKNLQKDLKSLSVKEDKIALQRFFKTGPGEYGEGDIFLGVKAGKQRTVAKKYKDLNLSEIKKLINSKIHEERMVSLFILIDQFEKNYDKQKEIYNFYMSHLHGVNNWDLVDASAPKIVGPFLLNKDKKILYELVKSKILWERRISIMATFAFIRENQFEDTLKLSEILLNDNHDLMHKAVGWMLREIGKKDQQVEEEFLKKHYKKMPRTMLRYAIEKFKETKRQAYLKGKI